MRIRRVPVDMQCQQMSSMLSAYVSLPAAPWEEADGISPMQRAREMRKAGATYTDIGAALGVSAGAVQHALGGR